MIRRGEIRWASLAPPEGSEPGYRRPVLVVQANSFNRSRIQTVIVVGLTSSLDRAAAPGNVLLPAETTGLPRDSIANVSQLLTLDRAFLDARVGRISDRLLSRVDKGLRLALEL